MKIMIVNSKKKHKSKIILSVIRNLALDFVLCYYIHYMRKYPINVAWTQGTTPNALYINWGGKKKNFYDKQFTAVTTQKKFQNYNNGKMYI